MSSGRMTTSCLAVGVMSGTSLDCVSTALVRLSDDPLAAQLVAFRQEPYGAAERGQIVEAIARGGSKDLALLHVALGERFAGAILQLLAGSGTAPSDVSFVASHGQTIWHEPGRATLRSAITAGAPSCRVARPGSCQIVWPCEATNDTSLGAVPLPARSCRIAPAKRSPSATCSSARSFAPPRAIVSTICPRSAAP